MPDLVARILRELDEEIVRLDSELLRLRVIRERMTEPIIPGEKILRRPDGRGYARVVRPVGEAEEPTEPEHVHSWKHGVCETCGQLEAPAEPQEAPAAEAEAPAPPEEPEPADRPALTIEGISPELAEKLAHDVTPTSVTHIPPVEPKKRVRASKGEPRKRLMRYPETWKSTEDLLVMIRDWVRDQGEKPFTASELAAGVGYQSSSYLISKAQPLIDQGVIVVVDQKLPRSYKYGGKPAPSSTPVPARSNGDEKREPGWKGEAVPGTGRSQLAKTADKDVHSLLQTVASQIDTRTDGSGHIRVTCKLTGQATVVYSTPRSSGLDKVRNDLRRIGVRF
jgi:hypothetical protein